MTGSFVRCMSQDKMESGDSGAAPKVKLEVDMAEGVSLDWSTQNTSAGNFCSRSLAYF